MKTFASILVLWVALLPLNAQDDGELAALRLRLARSIQQKDADSIATACYHISEYYMYRQTDSARYYCRSGLEHARSDKEEPYLPLLMSLANTCAVDGDIGESVRQHLFAYREAMRLHSGPESRAAILTSLGVSYRRKEMPDSALYYYNEALQLLEKTDACDNLTHLLTSIAVLYANLSRLDEGEAYIRRAVEASRLCDDIDMVYYARSTAGVILGLQGKYDEAVQMLHPAIGEARRQQKPVLVLKGLAYLINIFSRMDCRDSVYHYMQEAESIKKILPETASEVLGYEETRYQILTGLGRYRESLAVQQKLFALRGVNAQTPIDRLYRDMARNYEGLKDYVHAARCYEKAYLAADSLNSEQINARLSEWSVKYETQEKELEIARLTQVQLAQEAEMWRWIVVASVVLFVFLLWVGYYFFRRNRVKKEEELKLAQYYIDGMEQERARLAKDLHDGVCNDLLGISMQTQCLPFHGEEAGKRLLDMIEQVREEVRSISHELMPPKFRNVTLAEAVENYVKRMAVPSSVHLSFDSHCAGALQWKQVPEQVSYEVYRIVQELLSNAVKHSGATAVVVSLVLEEERLVLRIVSDGTVAPPEHTTARGGIGLNTVRERAKALNGVLSADDSGTYRVFTLEVPLSVR